MPGNGNNVSEVSACGVLRESAISWFCLSVTDDIANDLDPVETSRYQFVVSQCPRVGYFLAHSQTEEDAVYSVTCPNKSYCDFEKMPGKDIGVNQFGGWYTAMSLPRDVGFNCTPLNYSR